MKRLLFTMSLLIVLAFTLYSQEYNEHSKRTAEVEKPNAFLFAPFNLFDFVNPNFQIGYERFIAKKWSLQFEGGIIINHSIENYIIDWINGTKDCSFSNKGFRIKGSVKYMLVDKRKFKLYVSPELFYSRNKSWIQRDFLVSNSDFEYSEPIPEGMNGYTDFFYNDEEKKGVNFKVGIKLYLGKRYFFEPHLGIGFSHRTVNQSERENPNDELWSLLGIFDNAAPNKWVPTIPFNLKLGFRF